MPAAVPGKLVERGVKQWRVHRLAKRRVGVIAKPDHRPRPGLAIEGIASGVAPEDGAALLG